jgi:hypothetical protein
LDRLGPSVLIAAAKWWPLSARLASALRRRGCQVDVICPVGHPLTHVSGIRRIYRYAGILSLASLRRAVLESRPDIVVPCDDGVVAQLHALHHSDPSLRPIIERSLGPQSSFSVTESRSGLLELAVKLGIRVPKSRSVADAQDLIDWHATETSAALKVDGETGGNGVRISHSLDESIAAWRSLSTPGGYVLAWKRLVVDRDPLAVWIRKCSRVRGMTAQAFITGRPANSMFVCWRGRLLSLVSVAVVAAQGPTGAATIVRVIRNDEMRRAAELIVSALQLSGFYGLDFIVESGSGLPYLIEMNPRCTQLGHIEFADAGCLAGALAAVLSDEPRSRIQDPIPSDVIALFPQALAAGEACRALLAASYHDFPSDEPKLAKELMLKSWPQRQWAARLYHAFRPLARPDPVLFEVLVTNPAVIGSV